MTRQAFLINKLWLEFGGKLSLRLQSWCFGNAALSYMENTGSGASVDATQPALGGNLGILSEQRVWVFPLDGL